VSHVIALFLAVAASFVFTVTTTPMLIRYLRARHIGQQIRDDGPIPHPHINKTGTPSMGGFTIVGGCVIGYFAAHLHRSTSIKYSRSGITLLLLIVGLGAVGFIDDYLGIRKQRNLGLRKRGKLVGQIFVASGFALLCLHWVHASTHLSFTRDLHYNLGSPVWFLWAVLVIIGTANGVNLTDGLDGLCAGASMFVFAVYTIIAFWQFRHLAIYQVPGAQALDMATISAAMLGGCAGFLWWNAAPAQIIMGDTGSMAIGAAVSGLALLTRTQLLLPILGGLYMVETLSVIAQVISFRGFGRRVLRMSPIHHHFEVGGWQEITVTVRFWLFAGLCAAVGLGLFYADFLRLPGVHE
jgi:phospho-N-acetylmuramoyl-pentapeptide-transferase